VSLRLQVDDARRYLNEFWKGVRRLYVAKKLTYDNGDFFRPDKRWLMVGNAYRALVEPLDIALWYKRGSHTKENGNGHYIGMSWTLAAPPFQSGVCQPQMYSPAAYLPCKNPCHVE
jgi:hypothetical protein